MKVETRNLDFFYGQLQALFGISIAMRARSVTALIGPSGCGKSTYLRTLNRMNDIAEGTRLTGEVLVDGESIYDPQVDVVELRKKVGMVFQKSNPFPKSIFDNIAFGPRIGGERNRAKLEEIVVRSLHQAALWDEVKDRLHASALALSGGQQQRLCIARALAVRESSEAWSTLVRLYREESDVRTKDGLAVALSVAANRELIDELIELARDTNNGTSRMLLLPALTRSRQPQAKAALFDLASDPDLSTEIAVIRRRMERRKK